MKFLFCTVYRQSILEREGFASNGLETSEENTLPPSLEVQEISTGRSRPSLLNVNGQPEQTLEMAVSQTQRGTRGKREF